MTLKPDAKYPNRRAYVLKVRSDAQPHELAGRIENLVTGQMLEFRSGPELLESIAGDLQAGLDKPAIDANDK